MNRYFACQFYGFNQSLRYFNHCNLIKKLAHYGINGATLEWYTCYLTGRSGYVEFDGISSKTLSLFTGFYPRTSIISIDMNDIQNSLDYFNFEYAGVLHKLKHVLPIHISRTLYFSMVQSPIIHCMSTWKFDYDRIEWLYKKRFYPATFF